MSSAPESFTGFATLAGSPRPRPPSRFAQFFLAPFRDIDDRAARQAAAAKAEREARRAAMSGAAEPHRG